MTRSTLVQSILQQTAKEEINNMPHYELELRDLNEHSTLYSFIVTFNVGEWPEQTSNTS